MQTSAVATRVSTASHQKSATLVRTANRIVAEDTRIRNWASTLSGSAWTAPTSTYSIVGTASGDYIKKGLVAWDLSYQDLGANTPVTLPDGVTTVNPYITSVALSATKDLVVFYANRFRNSIGSCGVYAMTCVDDGASHLYWSQPEPIFISPLIADWNQESQLFVTCPILQVINSEYWVIALECGREINIITYHLTYSHSSDGIHWSRREVLAGVSNDPDESTQGVNKYDTNTPFTLDDIINAYLEISGTNVYLIGQNGNFVAPATSRVGVDNPAMQLDITPNTVSYNYSHPTSPSIAQTTFNVQNPNNVYDDNAILIPDAKITHKDGLVTSNGQEVVTLSTSWIDLITSSKQMQQKAYTNALKVMAGDSMIHLRDLADDLVYEYDSPSQSVFNQFCDLTALSTVNGQFFVGFGGSGTNLTSATLDPNAETDEDLGYIPQKARTDGSIEFRFRFENAVNIAVTAAGVFQGDVEMGERSFWSIAYWVVLGKWVLVKAVPTTTGRKIYNYNGDTIVYQGSAEALSPDTWYWLKVQWYHNHVMAFRSNDRITWTTVVDYSTANTVPANLGYSGLLGHSASSPTPIGNSVDASGGKQNMDKSYALKVTMGASPGTIYAIAGLFSQTDQPGDLTLRIVKDNGAGTAPANMNTYDNVLYQVSVRAFNYSNSDAPTWRAQPVPSGTRIAASQIVWIVATPGTVTGGQTWEWYSDTGGTNGTTMSSSDGSSWSAVASKSMAAYLLVDEDGGLTSFESMYWTSGEKVHTIEDLAHHIASKAHVLNITPQAFVSSSTLSGGWQPSSAGLLGDFVMDADVDSTSNPAQVYFRATTNGDATTGYKVVVNNTITIYYLNTLIYSIASMQYVPAGTYHLQITNQTQWVYIWINGALAATFYAADATTPGYFGVGIATFTNLRIPEMREIKPYWLLQTGESPMQNLSKLVDKSRYKFFMRYDDSLAIGSFTYASSLDTYSNTIDQTELQKTNRYAISQIQPSGNYWAQRWAAKILDLVGWRRFKKFDYTDAYSNEDAYLAGKRQLLLAQQQGEPVNMNVPIANFAAENEDRITNAIDGNDYVIDSITIDSELKSGKATMRTGLRRWIAGI